MPKLPPFSMELNLVIDTVEQERHKYAQAAAFFSGFTEMGVFWDWPSLLQGDPDTAERAKNAALGEGKSEEEAQEASHLGEPP